MPIWIDKLEEQVNRWLHIEPEKDDFLEAEDGSVQFAPLSTEERLAQFHDQPGREYWSRRVFRVVRRRVHRRYSREDFLRPLVKYHGDKGLAQARVICFRAETVGVKGLSGWMDGYLFSPGQNWSVALYLQTEFSLSHDLAFSWKRGQLEVQSWSENSILIPGKGLTPELVEEGVRRWYAHRFQWKYGHWTRGLSNLPEFRFDCEWEEVPEGLSPRKVRRYREFLTFTQGIRGGAPDRVEDDGEA
jgi:hypothetical protein